METAVIDSSEFTAISRGPRGSRYEETVNKLLALKQGQTLIVVPDGDREPQASRALIQSSVRAALNRLGHEDVKFSCQVSTDGMVGLRLVTDKPEPKVKPAPAKKTKAKTKKR